MGKRYFCDRCKKDVQDEYGLYYLDVTDPKHLYQESMRKELCQKCIEEAIEQGFMLRLPSGKTVET